MIIIITQEQLALLKFHGFLARYHEHCATMTCVEAYHKTEDELHSIFKINQFRNYQSFRNALYRHNQQRHNKKRLDK